MALAYRLEEFLTTAQCQMQMQRTYVLSRCIATWRIINLHMPYRIWAYCILKLKFRTHGSRIVELTIGSGRRKIHLPLLSGANLYVLPSLLVMVTAIFFVFFFSMIYDFYRYRDISQRRFSRVAFELAPTFISRTREHCTPE